MASPVTVALVLEPAFEVAHLHALAQRAHVWVVGTEFNVASARTFWATFPKANLTSSLTTFVPGAHPDRAAACLAMLDTIELHHGTASAPSPYPVLEESALSSSLNSSMLFVNSVSLPFLIRLTASVPRGRPQPNPALQRTRYARR